MRSRLTAFVVFSFVLAPFLVTYHARPEVSFYSEWVSAALGLLVVAVALVWRQGADILLPLPRAALALGVLATVLLIQWALGRLSYPEALLLVLLELVWGLLLLLAFARLRQTAGLAFVCRALAAGLVAAALLNIAVTILGRAGVVSALIANFAEGYGYGNLGQRNHFAHLLWLGIAAALYLAAQGGVRRTIALSAVAALALTTAAAGSRSTLIYAGWVCLLAALALPTGRRHLAAAAFAAYVLAAWQLPGLVGLGESESPVLRAATDNAPRESIRLVLLGEAWNMLLAHPWLGTGWGGFRAWSFNTGDRAGPWQGGAEHSHNLFANLAGETGIFPPLAVALVLGLWLRAAWRRRAEAEHRFLLMAAGISLVHAMVEYPFWYLFFLGPFLAVLALGDDTPWHIPLRRSLAALLVIAGAGVLGLIGRDYVVLEFLVKPSAASNETLFARRLEAILTLRRHSVIAPIADMALLGAMGPTPDNLEAKRFFCRMSLAYNPSRPGVYNCALIAELAGDRAEADRLWRLSGAGGDTGYLSLQRTALSPDEQVPLARFLWPPP